MCKKNDNNLNAIQAMTKRDFIKANEIKAFEIAMRQNPDKGTQWLAAEALLIIDEWWRDCQEEHV